MFTQHVVESSDIVLNASLYFSTKLIQYSFRKHIDRHVYMVCNISIVLLKPNTCVSNIYVYIKRRYWTFWNLLWLVCILNHGMCLFCWYLLWLVCILNHGMCLFCWFYKRIPFITSSRWYLRYSTRSLLEMSFSSDASAKSWTHTDTSGYMLDTYPNKLLKPSG